MKNPRRLLIIFFLIITSQSFSQKLKKADRIIVENLAAHLNYLSDDRLKEHQTGGSEGERIAEEYIVGQFKKTGYRAAGDSSSWLQKFNIADGKEIEPASRLSINGKELLLYADFFPFAFSASKKTEASVVMELAEDGVPWFADLKDLLDNDSAGTKDTSALINERARRAAAKGATALIIYNNSRVNDLVYNSKDPAQPAGIPVIYITKPAMKKYLSKGSSALDLRLNVEMKDRIRQGSNVAAFADNKADSTVAITAHLDDDKGVAALIEVSRLLKNKQYRFRNYLFIVFSGEDQGSDETKYLTDHPDIHSRKAAYALNFDMFTDKGLPAVQQSIAAINALKDR